MGNRKARAKSKKVAAAEPPAVAEPVAATPPEPSVTAFLARITGQPRSITAAGRTVKSLLGDVTHDDLRRAGRTPAIRFLDPVDDVLRFTPPPKTTATATIRAEVSQPPMAVPASGRPPRVRLRMPVDIRGVFHPIGAPPVATDLSVGGVFVETASPLDVGDHVVVAFPAGNGHGEGAFSVNGRVRWVTPFGRLDDARPGMGIEFIGVDAVKRARLADLLARRSKEDAS